MMRKRQLVFLGTCTVILLQGIALAGPTIRRSSRMIREVYPEIETEKLEGNQAEVCIVGDVVYGAEEPVPADQPCLKCKCQPPGVQCETTRCAKKPGCKAIHKPNKCCPEYQCECEHEGRLYANGERLETPPGGECRVCYCRGGEVQCAEVSCYIRTDCEGRTVPGQCCPKYDHCPPREPLVDRGGSAPAYTTTQVPEASGYWPSTNLTSPEQTTTVYDQVQDIANEEDNNRITETQSADKATQTDPLEEEDPASNETSAENKEEPRITIHEIIPEIKEIPITGPPKHEISVEAKVSNKVDDLDQEKANEDDLALADAESDSSEISEVYHHPPPVLKIGDQLLFLKKGELVPGKDVSTPLPVITIIGAEGLQRGGTEESGEAHEVPASQVPDPAGVPPTSQTTNVFSLIKPKSNTQTTDEDTTKSSLSTIEDFLLNLTKAKPTGSDDDLYLENVDPSTTIMMDNIVNKIRTLTNVESTTDVAHLVGKVYVADVEDASNLTTWYEVRSVANDTSEEVSTEPSDGVENSTQSIPIPTPEVKGVSARYEDLGEASKTRHEDESTAIDQNPEYPPIPDIMSPQNVDELAEHIDSELAQVSSVEPANVSAAVEVTTQTAMTTLKGEERQNKTGKTAVHPLINENASLPTSLLEQVAPSDFREDIEEAETSPAFVIDASRSPTVSLASPTEIPASPTASATIPPSNSSPTTDPDRSRETLEAISGESGESTTPKNRHASILLSTEDASVETTQGGSQEFDTTDLVETVPGFQSGEQKGQETVFTSPRTVLAENDDVEILDPIAFNKTKESMIIAGNKSKAIESKALENATQPAKSVKEVEAKSDDLEGDDIFRQLNEELKTVPSNVIHKAGGEEEAEAIFRELLEEATSSTLPPKETGTLQPRDRESQLLQKVSDVITKFQAKESQQNLDASILGILRDFFSSQYKYYAGTKK